MRRRRVADDATTTTALTLLMLLLTVPRSFGTQPEAFCSAGGSDGRECDLPNGRVCSGGKCVSACALHGLSRCRCPDEADEHCYLCCGDSDSECRPAHENDILRQNGERWERDDCRRCRASKLPVGFPCSDKDVKRLCYDGRCTKSICRFMTPGGYCDQAESKVCVDQDCYNPCSAYDDKLMVCECSERDRRTGMRSSDRCQLCCFEYGRGCLNAFREWGIESASQRPIFREGLSCATGRSCDRFGGCTDGQAIVLPSVFTAFLLSGLAVLFPLIRR